MFDKFVLIVLLSDREVERDAADRTNMCLLDKVRFNVSIGLDLDYGFLMSIA